MPGSRDVSPTEGGGDPEGTGPSDADLVALLKRRPDDWRSFETLVRRHQTRVVTNCRYLSRSVADAEDLAQEVFVKAFFGLKGFEGRSSFGTWVHRLKINHCLNYLERRRRTFVPVDEPALESEPAMQTPPEVLDDLAAAEERRRIQRILDSMADTLRVPLLLRDLDGLSYQEIAETLNVGLSAVKMRIRRGREEFRALYGGPVGAGA
jgi:RNA polymerase sigma-70 factor (ECF subfamily)